MASVTPRSAASLPAWRLLSSSLARSSGLYVASNILNRAVPFLLLPVLTRYLSPEDLGTVAMFTLALSLTLPVIGLNTDGAIARQYFERDHLDFPNYVANCLYVLAATTVLGTVAATALAGLLSSALALPRAWIWMLVPVSAARFLMAVVLALWQVRGQPKRYATFFLLQTVLSFGLSIWFIVGLGHGWRGRILGEILSLVAVALIGGWVLVRGGWVRPGVNWDHVRHALRFGGGLVPHAYGGVLMGATDRFFLTHMVGLAATGLYAVGAQVAMVIGVLEHSFNQAWSPWLFERLKRGDPDELRAVARITRVYNLVILALAGALALVAPRLLAFFVGPEFVSAGAFVGWLALAGAFSGMYKMVVNQIFYANKTHVLGWITLVTGLVNVATAYLLIRWNGAIGAAQATAFAYFLSYALTAFFSARLMPAVR